MCSWATMLTTSRCPAGVIRTRLGRRKLSRDSPQLEVAALATDRRHSWVFVFILKKGHDSSNNTSLTENSGRHCSTAGRANAVRWFAAKSLHGHLLATSGFRSDADSNTVAHSQHYWNLSSFSELNRRAVCQYFGLDQALPPFAATPPSWHDTPSRKPCCDGRGCVRRAGRVWPQS